MAGANKFLVYKALLAFKKSLSCSKLKAINRVVYLLNEFIISQDA
jgi:hypothetical protein